jgi:hypothetical protein
LAWRRSHFSGLAPNAFDSRTAISGEIPAFPFTRLLRDWWVTPMRENALR